MWDISGAFRQALLSPVHTVAIRAQVLDTDYNVVEGGEFYSTGTERYIQNYIVDGTVDVDGSRGTRRTFTLQLLNPDAEFSPGSDWAGLFYVNRLIRIWRGVDYGSSEEWVPLGTFFIDSADIVVERNMSMVPLAGSDGWKKLVKAQFGTAISYPAGTDINDVFYDMANRAGVTRMVFDDLNDRDADGSTLNVKLSYERGDFIGDELLKLAKSYGLDIYFDPMGRLVTQDFLESGDKATVWEYRPGETNNLLGMRVAYKDDDVYNHILVVGTGAKDAVVTDNLFDRDPLSPTNIDAIGRRTFVYETDKISTVRACSLAAKRLFTEKVSVSEDVTLDAICNPAFEANDVVAVVEGEFTNINTRYRIRSFTVPLASSRQAIKLHRDINVSGSAT
jgi:hypothetical protein